MHSCQFKPNDTEILVMANVISSSLSAAGTLFIVLFYIFFKELRSFGSRLVFYMSLADLGDALIRLSLARAFDQPNSLSLCKFQAYSTNYFQLSSILWTTVIMFCLYKITQKPHFKVENLEKYFIFYAYVLPLLLSGIPFIWDAYGPNPGLCWISEVTQNDQTIRLVLTLTIFYGPLWLSVAINTFLGCAVSSTLKRVCRKTQSTSKINKFYRLKYYSFALVFCWIPGTITRIYTIFSDESTPELWLIFSCIFMGSLQGFINSFIYGTNKKVRERIKYVFYTCCTCFKCFISKNKFEKPDFLLQNQVSSQEEIVDNLAYAEKEETDSKSDSDHQQDACDRQDSINNLYCPTEDRENKLWLSDKIDQTKLKLIQDRRLLSLESRNKVFGSSKFTNAES